MHALLYTRTVYHRTKPRSYSKSATQKMDEYFSWFYGNSEPVELLGDPVIHHLNGFLTYHLEIFFDPSLTLNLL